MEAIKGKVGVVTPISGRPLPITPIKGRPYPKDYPVYQGDYEVDPKARNIVLETSGKVMEQDVTVKKISLYEVSNESGTTVYIGGM